MSDIRDDARDAFAHVFGHEPLGVWSAPGVVSLPGEPAMSCAVDSRMILALGLRDDRTIRVASTLTDEAVQIDLVELNLDALSGWAAYPLSAAWALGQQGADLGAVPGVDILIESDIPVGSGLGSSTALVGVIALALNDVWQLGHDLEGLTRICQRAESTASGISTTMLSAAAVFMSEPNRGVRSLDDGEYTTGPLGFDTADTRLVLIDPDAETSIQPELAIDVATENGATAAHILPGGSVVAVAPASAVSRIRVAIDGAFAEHGFGQPHTFTLSTSHAAMRE